MINQKVIYSLVVIGILLLVGTIFFNQVEGWSYVDSFYFSTITLTTIGYGDLVPTHDHSKAFTSLYALLGVGVMLYILSSVVAAHLLQPIHFGKIFSVLGKLSHHEREIKKLKKEIKKKK